MQMVRSATESDIARVTRGYATGALLAVRAGFDCLEVHLGHSYLLSAFLSPLLNRRKDHWGGSLDNRARFGQHRSLSSNLSRVGGRLDQLGKSEVQHLDGIVIGDRDVRRFQVTMNDSSLVRLCQSRIDIGPSILE